MTVLDVACGTGIEWESVETFADFFMARFGPMVTARAMLGDRFLELRGRIVEIWNRANQSNNGSFRLPQQYLLSIVRLPTHSARSASRGFIRVARCAGRQQAASAIASTRTATPAATTGSSGATP